jgi:oligoendopeptidase F
LGLDLFSSLSSSSMRVCILLRKRQRCTDLLKNQTMVDSFRRRLYAMRRTLRVASFSPIAFLDWPQNALQ